MMYYFCNDYIIEPGSHIRRRSKNIKPLKEDFFTVASESDYSVDNSSERKSPTVSVSAIVGMNGDGKSTLVELMMRLINNCAISYELCASSDSLRRVKDVKAELYYMVDNVIYRMVEEKKQDKTQIWKMTELDDNNGEMMRWEMKPKKIEHVDKDSGCFFFTIVSNYSHYAYNINDFKEEWEVKEGDKDDDEKCWLHYVFHKNDGYLTPITLHPYRYKGNIDINVEKDLSKQRLLSLFLNADNPYKDGKSFRNVNGKYANTLKLTEEAESKLQQRAIVKCFEASYNDNKFNGLIQKIDEVDSKFFESFSSFDSIQNWLDESKDLFNNLVDYVLPTHFYNPLNQIVKQDVGFSDFANDVIHWFNSISNNKYQNKGDIKSVVERYDKLNERIIDFITVFIAVLTFIKKTEAFDYDKEQRYFEKVLKKSISILGKDHLLTASVYNNLAVVYKAKGAYGMALRYYNKALKIWKAKLEKNHPILVFTYIDMAVIYRNIGDVENSLYYFVQVECKLGNDYPSAAIRYNNTALRYKDKKAFDVALRYFLKAKDVCEQTMGINHIKMVAVYCNLSGLWYARDIETKAYEYCEKAIEIINSQSSIMNPLLFVFYNNDIEVIVQNMQMIENKTKEHKMSYSQYVDLYGKIINSTQLGRLDTIYRIIQSYGFNPKIVTNEYSQLTLEEKCQHYIIYKVWSILSTYPQFEKAINDNKMDSFREFDSALEECVEVIKNDQQSHITQKLRQVNHFMKQGFQNIGLYGALGTKDKETGKILVEIDKLKSYYGGKSFSLDNLPPPIYKWDIVFKKKEDSSCDIELDSFSSGEKQLLNSIGAIIYHLQNLANTSSGVKYDNVNLVMEEIELYYHPEYQRLFLIRLLDSIRRAKLEKMKNINIVFVTHSPFILSDIPKCNVLFLKDGMPKDIMQENTFGANIHTLLKNGFFMPNLPIGEFAYGKINALFNKLNTGDFDNDDEEKRKKDLNDIYQQILLVGEPFLRNQLLMLYNAFKGGSVVPMRTNEKGTAS